MTVLVVKTGAGQPCHRRGADGSTAEKKQGDRRLGNTRSPGRGSSEIRANELTTKREKSTDPGRYQSFHLRSFGRIWTVEKFPPTRHKRGNNSANLPESAKGVARSRLGKFSLGKRSRKKTNRNWCYG